ncbi:hypothetical protein K2173_001991 [Erythroxylum novogranatense]|uniref:Methyltransferase type 11 domain-containing protein n=1 Tax=Erythroxylum novogranatense TaxID=1862640 RepID=A0AAV8SPH7_9ROSI|nr:hypothetical protein K2173_001991 [Erythroxylum novogranatense]
MDLKALRFQILSGSVARRLLLRSFILASAVSVFSLLQFLSGSDTGLIGSVYSDECDVPRMYGGVTLFANRLLMPIWSSLTCKEDVNWTTGVVRELIDMKMLDYGAKVLYVGEGSSGMCAFRELGFTNVCGVHRHPFFSLKHRKLVYELQYADNSFDFVFSMDLDKVSVPAILVLEIERIVKPGGIGAMLVSVDGMSTNSLIRSATPVSSLLKDSSVIHVGYVQGFTLVVLKKRIDTTGYFQQFHLPAECQSVVNNRPLMEYVEPLTVSRQIGYEKRIAYLLDFIDMHSRKRLVYVHIGLGENLNSTSFPPYPVNQNSFNTYIVDHNTSVLLSYVKKPGITFIYYPGLSGEKAIQNPQFEDLDPSMVDEGFDFLAWFKETVQFSDFVVLKMKTGKVELKFLIDLFKSGTICFVDELFLNCSDGLDGKGLVEGDCMDLFKSLRSSGIFVHQWWGD